MQARTRKVRITVANLRMGRGCPALFYDTLVDNHPVTLLRYINMSRWYLLILICLTPAHSLRAADTCCVKTLPHPSTSAPIAWSNHEPSHHQTQAQILSETAPPILSALAHTPTSKCPCCPTSTDSKGCPICTQCATGLLAFSIPTTARLICPRWAESQRLETRPNDPNIRPPISSHC